MFWDNLCQLCVERNIKVANLAKELGLSSGLSSYWKKGKIPNDTTLVMIANHFGITKEELLYGRKSTTEPPEPVAPASDISRLMTILERNQSLWERDKDETKAREDRLHGLIKEQQETIRLLSGKIP